jgi:hypothetical protein
MDFQFRSARPDAVPWLLDEAFLRVRIVWPSMVSIHGVPGSGVS